MQKAIKSMFQVLFSTIRNKNGRIAFVFLLLGLILTATVAFYSYQTSKAQAEKDFASECNEIQTKFSTRLHAQALLLRSGAAFFSTSDSVTRKQWKAFIEGMRINKNLPGVQGVGYSTIVPKKQLQAHIQKIRKEGFRDYMVKPSGDRAVYSSVIYLEPFSGRNLRAFGYDMFSDSIRRKAMELSRDSDAAMLTAKVILVQETAEDVQSGFIMLVPVYRNGMPNNTVEQRRAAIKGWVYSPFRMNDLIVGILMKKSVNEIDHPTHIQIYDNDCISDEALLFDSMKADTNTAAGINLLLPFNFNGKHWTLKFFQPYDSEIFAMTLFILVSGFIISLLVFFLIKSLYNIQSKSREEQENAGKFRSMAEDLEKAQSVARLGKWKWNLKTGEVSWSDEMFRIFGIDKATYTGSLGDAISKVIHPDDLYLVLPSNADNFAKKIPIEYRIILPDQSIRYILAESGENMVDSEGAPSYMTGVAQDITERKQIELELFKAKDSLEKFFNLVPAMVSVASNGYLKNLNPEWEKVLGYTVLELESKPYVSFIHPDDIEPSVQELGRQLPGSANMNFQNRYRHKDGSYRWLEWNGNMEDKDTLYGAARDITKSKLAQIALTEKEEHIRLLLNSAAEAIYGIDLKGNCTFCNPACVRYLGYNSPEDLIGKNMHYLIHSKHADGTDFEIEDCKIFSAFRNGVETHADDELLWRANDTCFPAEFWSYPQYRNGEIVGAVVTFLDITDRKQAEVALHNQNELFSTLLKNLQIGVYMIEVPSGKPLLANEASFRLLGRGILPDVNSSTISKVYDLYKSGSDSVYPNEELPLVVAMEGVSKHVDDMEVQKPDGTRTALEVSGSPVQDENGHIWASLVSFQDITKRKKTEKALLETNAYLENLINYANAPIIVWDPQFRITRFNHAFEFLTGRTEAEVLGQSLDILFPPELGEDSMALIQKTLTGEHWESVEIQILNVDGSIWTLLWNSATLFAADGTTPMATIAQGHDITRRLLSEAELHEREVQYYQLANSGRALIWRAGTDKLCYYFNKIWLDFTGRTLEQEMGNGWAEGVHPDDLDRCLDIYITSFDKREAFEMEYRLRHFSGEYKWLLDIGTPNFDSTGEFVGYIGHCFDISDRKQAEQEIILKNEQLVLLSDEKDKFFSIIAHDLRSPFNGFLGLTKIMVEQISNMSTSELKELLVSLESSATNLYSLLENLLEWAQMQRGMVPYDPEEIQLQQIADECIGLMMEPARKKGIHIVSNIPKDFKVMVDVKMIQTVIRNFISNAVKFTKKDGKISISAKALNDGMAEISVRDTGIGMSKNLLDNLFNFTQKTNRPGTEGESSNGLGLLLCNEFVAKHGGQICVESEEGIGSVFYFTIPFQGLKINESLSEQAVQPTAKVIQEKRLKILIAEDDDISQMLLEKTVEKFSNGILKAGTGIEAVEVCRENPDIDLILMDIHMPEMNGYEATMEIRKFNSSVIIFAQTAYASAEDRNQATQAGCTNYLTKPIMRDKLTELIHQYFDI